MGRSVALLLLGLLDPNLIRKKKGHKKFCRALLAHLIISYYQVTIGALLLIFFLVQLMLIKKLCFILC